MKKPIVSAIVCLFAIMSFAATITHSHSFKSPDIQENTIMSSHALDDDLPFSDDGKLKVPLVSLFTTLVLLILVKHKNNDVNQSTHHFKWITPIFYQSNYVVNAL
ncbi:hypothetical protein [Bacillus nitroreducens]